MCFHYELTHNIHYTTSCIIVVLSVNEVIYEQYKKNHHCVETENSFYRSIVSEKHSVLEISGLI